MAVPTTAIFGVGLTLLLVIFGNRLLKNVDFLISAFIAGSFFYSHISPYFDPKMKVFQVLFIVTIGIGAAVGGVLGVLSPKITSGVVLGFLVALYIGLASYTAGTWIAFAFTCGIAIPVLVAAALRWDVVCSMARTAMALGLLFSVSVDSALEGALFDALSRIVRFKEADANTCFSECHIPALLGAWIVAAVVEFLVRSRELGLWKKWFARGPSPYSYDPVPTQNAARDPKLQQKTFSYPDALESNFFDPDNIPEPLQVYSLVFPVVQRLGALHGFQVDSTRNQSEHLLMILGNEAKETDGGPIDAVRRVHDKLFYNYRKWCDKMGTKPLVCPDEIETTEALIEDVLLQLCVWGEAANLRHMPECTCFLFHKMRQEREHFVEVCNSKDMFPGYFLDMVVTPIYEVVSTGLSKKCDHNERKTYDDFNEFFWSPLCLEYRITPDIHHDPDDAEAARNAGGPGALRGRHVSAGLNAATKTYVEKRSWLHPLLTLRRIFEWHALTFTLLVACAFSNKLVWSWAYSLKVASFIFWEINFFSILWACLEVWTLYPNASIPGPSVCGYAMRLAVGFLVLVYQSVYYHWSFRPDAAPGSGMRSQGDMNFWWWQFMWLSLVTTSIYMLEAALCWFPWIATLMMTNKNELFQALLNILYPTSQLFVGKKTDVPQSDVFVYIFFWLTLLAFKLWFGYRYIVFPVTTPSLELFDDYMNFQNISFPNTMVLFFVWWFPHYMVYLIDLSIWYSVWTSMVGGFVALVERQGAVRESKAFQSHFMRAPLAFCQKLMPASSRVGAGIARGLHASRTDLVQLPKNSPAPTAVTASPRIGGPKSPTGLHTLSKGSMRARSSADLHAALETATSPIVPSAAAKVVQPGPSAEDFGSVETIKSSMSSFLTDDVALRWVAFSTVWNDVVTRLRDTDHLSNKEMEMYLFWEFDWLSKPVYLPLFQIAGSVENSIHYFKDAAVEFESESNPEKKMSIADKFANVTMDVTCREAVSEAWELTSWFLIAFLGHVHADDIRAITQSLGLWAADLSNGDLIQRISAESIFGLTKSLGNVVAQLRGCLAKRKKNPVVTPEVLRLSQETVKTSNENEFAPAAKKGGLKKSVSTGFLSGLQADNDSSTSKTADKSKRFTKLKPFRKDFVLADNTRDKVREELRSLLTTLRNALRMTGSGEGPGVSPEGQDLIARLTFVLSLETGFMWSDTYASMQIDEFARDDRSVRALTKLNGLLKLRQTEVTLKSSEALRRLNFFMNSLFMDMPQVPSSRYAKEYTCMTPFYSEDVLLTRGDLEEKNSDNISTMLYLQTLYKQDWLNFLERRGISDDNLVFSREHLQATRMWASLRAQTLFRTVEGMMYSEAAIRLFAKLENLATGEIDLLAKLKFNYVVACQVYGQMRKNLDHKADDIEFLLERHPNLRVAYIDAVRPLREGETSFYSVLIRHDPATSLLPNASRTLAIKEVFRVKLPGNPVIGEGKPENQNHAIIFSRGRYLQAIDMNQDGYFEEALKMRNLLEEFDRGHAIIGFREHIFTGSVSSVANYMALQELSFVTLGQRVLSNPLCIRQHYGHPDFFDKFFVMTEGGMSKASKGINLSEDVFAGFNATIRGHTVGFKEYVQCGKGRDVGLQQTYKFEAKLSQGNSEQSLSRDLFRICDRLDFFRLLSFYYGGIGHYVANTMVMFTLVLVVYTMLCLAIFGQEGVNSRPVKPEGVLQLMLSGLGLLQTLPLFVTLTVEKGFLLACSEIAYMMISGGPLYFIFHIQTKCYYFAQTLLAGGAMYRPTGRGFVIRHSPFDENFRFFASSHIYIGFELVVALVLIGLYTKSKQYGGLTWSLWLTAASFILGPFWFNPVTFQWNKVAEDYEHWSRWMAETGGASDQSWGVWWREENTYFKGLSISWKLFLFVQKCCLWSFVALGLMGKRFLHDTTEQHRLMSVIGIFIFFMVANWGLSKMERSFTYAVRRFASLLLSAGVAGILLYIFCTHTVYIRYTVAVYYASSALSFFCLLVGFAPIQQVYKVHDYVVGHSIFFVLGFLSCFQLGYLQTWLLYHNALEKGIAMEDILKFARRSKEKAVSAGDDMDNLRAQVAEQERTIRNLMQKMRTNGIDLETADGLGPAKATEMTSLLPSKGASAAGAAPRYGGVSVDLGDTARNAATAATANATSKLASPVLVSSLKKGPVLAGSSVTPITPVLSNAPPALVVGGGRSRSSPSPSSSSSSTTGQNGDSLAFVAPSPAAAPGEFLFSQPTKFPSRGSSN